MSNGAPEHVRIAAISPLHSRDHKFPIILDDYADNGTVNQKLLSSANSLAVSVLRPDLISALVAQRRLLNYLTLQSTHGHMSLGTGHFDINEQFASDPHAALHGGWAAMALYETHLARDQFHIDRLTPALAAAMIDWWAAHLLGLSHFWVTGAGVRMPCARAKFLPGQFTWESRVYARVMLGESGHTAAQKYGGIPPGAKYVFDVVLESCKPLFPAIKARMATVALKLGNPIRRWDGAGPNGGFVAAYVRDSPDVMAPMGWCIVDGQGKITGNNRLLSEGFNTSGPEPNGLPTIVIG